MLEMDNGSWEQRIYEADPVHFCGGPSCCRDEEETREKMSIAYTNLYTGHSWRVPAESRMTYFRLTGGLVCFGVRHRRLLPSSLASCKIQYGDGDDDAELDAATLGSGAADLPKLEFIYFAWFGRSTRTRAFHAYVFQ